MNKWYVGIDPGKKGGVVVLDYQGNYLSKHTIPMLGDDVNISAFYGIFMDIKKRAEDEGCKAHICIESVHSIFGTSAGSNFTFGYVVGMIDTTVIAHSLPYSKVQPKIWQKEIWQEYEIAREPGKKDKNGKLKPGKVLTKLTSLKAFTRLFPTVDLRGTERSKNQHDGLVDAILIAEYCRRQNH